MLIELWGFVDLQSRLKSSFPHSCHGADPTESNLGWRVFSFSFLHHFKREKPYCTRMHSSRMRTTRIGCCVCSGIRGVFLWSRGCATGLGVYTPLHHPCHALCHACPCRTSPCHTPSLVTHQPSYPHHTPVTPPLSHTSLSHTHTHCHTPWEQV